MSQLPRAQSGLAAEYPGDSTLPVFDLLRERLALRLIGPLNRALAGEMVCATEGSIATAQRVFGSESGGWLAPFWAELATAILDLQFDVRDEALHAAPFFLRAGKWTDACACIESIPSWRRQPAPLAWMIEATPRIAGVDPLWSLVAKLSWMAPRRAEALTKRLQIAEMTKLVRCFHVEGEGTADDFAWLPAWALIVHPQSAERFNSAQVGADTAPERCARLLLALLAFERQGRHAMLIEGRKNCATPIARCSNATCRADRRLLVGNASRCNDGGSDSREMPLSIQSCKFAET
jgi:hypothetical protein